MSTLPLACLIACVTSTADAPPEGHWVGPLRAGGVELTMVWHVARDGERLRATFDSPDQGATGLAVDEFAIAGDDLSVTMKAIRGAYKAKLNADRTEAVGTWTQLGRSTPLTIRWSREAPSTLVVPAALAGTWEGTLQAGAGMTIRLGLKVEDRPGGVRVASFSSPDQGVATIPITAITLADSKVTIASKLVGGTFVGAIDAGRSVIKGEWTQAGHAQPLTLKRTEKLSEPKRAQAVRPPFPYKAEDVSYPNEEAGITLAGTLTVPEGAGPFPAVVMITGSGSQDRDETLLGHKPFLVIADALTRRGVAVLRVDDRGVGGSTGNPTEATSSDYATDVEAGIAFLKTRREVDPKAIGLVGHSEGGLIAPIVAARSADVAFIVLMAGPGTTGAVILKAQNELILKASGASEAVIKTQVKLISDLIDAIVAEPDPKAVAPKLTALIDASIKALPEADRKALGDAAASTTSGAVERLNSPWFRYFLKHDPVPVLTKVRCPVLAINGALDLQVPARANLDGIAAALKAGGNARATTREFPGLNHLFQACETGSPSEYAKIEETVNPAVLTVLGDWIRETTGRR